MIGERKHRDGDIFDATVIWRGEDQSTARFENPVEFGKRAMTVEQMRQGFPEPDYIKALVLKRLTFFCRGRNKQ